MPGLGQKPNAYFYYTSVEYTGLELRREGGPRINLQQFWHLGSSPLPPEKCQYSGWSLAPTSHLCSGMPGGVVDFFPRFTVP